MRTAVLEKSTPTARFMQLAATLNGRASSPLTALTHSYPIPTMNKLSGFGPEFSNPARLRSPRMSRATVDGMSIPILAGMDTHIRVKDLKNLLDLDASKQLMLETGQNRAKILKDEDVIDLALACALAIITLNLAS